MVYPIRFLLECLPLVNWLLNLVSEQKQVIENQEKTKESCRLITQIAVGIVTLGNEISASLLLTRNNRGCCLKNPKTVTPASVKTSLEGDLLSLRRFCSPKWY
jgi:hypothetical protein